MAQPLMENGSTYQSKQHKNYFLSNTDMNKHTNKVLGAIAFTFFAIACQQSTNNGSDNPEGTAAVRADTLTYTSESFQHTSEHILITTEVTDTTVYKVSYPVFNDDQLNEIIRYSITNSDTATVEDVAVEFIAEYDGYFERFDFVSTWFVHTEISVQHNTPSYVSLVSDGQSYTGGAHGNYNTRFIHYDTQEKKELVLSDWVSPERLNELTAVAERFFRVDEGLAPNQELDSYFFDFGRFSLPDNFYIAQGSLHFLYNVYEIKSYAEGQTTLSIPFDDVEHLMTDKAKLIHEEIKDKEILSL